MPRRPPSTPTALLTTLLVLTPRAVPSVRMPPSPQPRSGRRSRPGRRPVRRRRSPPRSVPVVRPPRPSVVAPPACRRKPPRTAATACWSSTLQILGRRLPPRRRPHRPPTPPRSSRQPRTRRGPLPAPDPVTRPVSAPLRLAPPWPVCPSRSGSTRLPGKQKRNRLRGSRSQHQAPEAPTVARTGRPRGRRPARSPRTQSLSTRRGPSPTSRPSCPTAPDTSSAALRHHASARRLAVPSTSSSIASVSRPVNVFCWLGW